MDKCMVEVIIYKRLRKPKPQCLFIFDTHAQIFELITGLLFTSNLQHSNGWHRKEGPCFYVIFKFYQTIFVNSQYSTLSLVFKWHPKLLKRVTQGTECPRPLRESKQSKVTCPSLASQLQNGGSRLYAVNILFRVLFTLRL